MYDSIVIPEPWLLFTAFIETSSSAGLMCSDWWVNFPLHFLWSDEWVPSLPMLFAVPFELNMFTPLRLEREVHPVGHL